MHWAGKAEVYLVEAVGVAIDQSMCSSILTLLPLLLQNEGKELSVHSVTASKHFVF